MLRLLLVLLLVLPFRPLLVGAETYAQLRGSVLAAGIGSPESGGSTGALRPLGGWELLPPLEQTGRLQRKRDGGSRSLGELEGPGGVAAVPALSLRAMRRGEAALLDAGVLRLRYEHLPYFATAPPSTR